MNDVYDGFLLSKDQKIKVAQMALEAIKDAPLLLSEREAVCRDALHLMTFGNYQSDTLSEWGKRVLKVVIS